MRNAPSPPIGLAFKPQHFAEAMAPSATVDFFEVHAENYFGAGGLPHHQLEQLRGRRPLYIHGVGLSLGAVTRPQALHLQRLRQLLSRHPAVEFSEHLAWSSHGQVCLPDLLPVAYDDDSYARVRAHVDEAQSALGRRLLIENPSHYLPMSEPLAEVQFLDALQRDTGCGLLLDLNNVVVSCHNQGADPFEYLRSYPLHAVAQFHLAGHREQVLGDGSMLRIDDHASPVGAAALALYAEALQRTGPQPTLIEWDNAVPAWSQLLQAVARVRRAAQRALDGGVVA